MSEIAGLEFVEWGRDVRLSVRNSPEDEPALLGRYTDIHVHKLILCARSPVFRAMLLGEMTEEVNSEVVIEDCCPTAIKSLMSFMYTGSLSFECVSHCVEVYSAADKYEVLGLMKLCEAYMLEKVEMSVAKVEKDDFFTIWKAAEEKNIPKVENACLAFLDENDKQLKQSWPLYPSFLTHEQARKVREYDKYGEVPDLVSESDWSDY
eukprot:gene11944-13853_t